MKIFLTGNKGFIGSHLEKRLLELKHEVRGCDIKTGVVEDIRNNYHLKAEFKKFKPDIVIHLAALTGVRNSGNMPDDYVSTNIYGTYNLLRWSAEFEVKKFLFASSSSVYGDQKSPLKESMLCDNPVSLYAVTKKTGELLCKMFSQLPTIVFRPFTVYGEKGRTDMAVGGIIEAAKTGKVFQKFGDGTSTRGYTNVKDLVEGIIKLISYKPKSNFEIFNLGGTECISINDLVTIVKERFPNLKVEEVAQNPVDVFQSYADIGKARKKLGWKPKTNFKEEVLKLCS